MITVKKIFRLKMANLSEIHEKTLSASSMHSVDQDLRI